MTLQEQLDALKAQSANRIPAETRAIMQRATEDLRRSGILTTMLKAGDKAPEFALPNTRGDLVSSKRLLAHGPLVASFYRGRW